MNAYDNGFINTLFRQCIPLPQYIREAFCLTITPLNIQDPYSQNYINIVDQITRILNKLACKVLVCNRKKSWYFLW